MIWREQNGNDFEDMSLATGIDCGDVKITQDNFAQDCDLNYMMARFGVGTDKLPLPVVDPRFYGDVSNVPSLRAAMDIVHEAKERFAELPPDIRARFVNSPGVLWDFVNDPRNFDEAVKMGILARDKPAGSAPPVTPPVPTPSASAAEPLPAS
ncbi:MAG: internal scaffolding protein [Microvirus sp.]|nr:MAG: internal scaffolding protein [Microvirus sp.]